MSKLTDYAIVLLAHLAQQGATRTAQGLAERSHVPLPTVSKLCKELSRAGILVSHRGRRGGYSLARPADRITVAEIVEALEGPIALTECVTPGSRSCELELVCPARGSWDPISRAIHGALENLPLSAIAPFRLAPSEAGAAPGVSA
ncbi:MAG TPA: SUF system Fe-S cluster assembly regulator [Anaeromyxobacteraceae bacterium]|nr:SUF system Fe-S cluster assembly regulator [Anaeromyxobacteraceae bacterium]